MIKPNYPSLYQVNTRVWLTEISQSIGREATLDDIPDFELSRIAKKGFDWVWFLCVWQTGEFAQKIARHHLGWRDQFERILPDLKDEDIAGSGFAVARYRVHRVLGGNSALKRLRKRMASHGLKLMLDFVPNHLALDHPWVATNPEFFILGTIEDFEKRPDCFNRIQKGTKEMVIAMGRDPFFPAWPDTAQLDYSHSGTVEAMKNELLQIATLCDGLRCDMAMLVVPDVFDQTWGRKGIHFWPDVINATKEKFPDFCFIAEVYWDMESLLLAQGFDYAYDKILYDRLLDGCVRDIRAHLEANVAHQNRLVRFLENHDEERASAAFFDIKNHEAAAILTFLLPGLRFFHQGQLEGKTKRISIHLVREPQENINGQLFTFYGSLLELLQRPIFRYGEWSLLTCDSAWEGNGSFESIIAFTWLGLGEDRIVVVVNYKPHPSQCYLKLPFTNHAGGQWRLRDLLRKMTYERDGNELRVTGLYLDLEPWQYHVFVITKIKKK